MKENKEEGGYINYMITMDYLFWWRTSFVRCTLIVLLAAVFFTSCSGTNFRQEGFLELGEMMAKDSCRKTMSPRDYEACVSRVRENYDDTYQSSNLERR